VRRLSEKSERFFCRGRGEGDENGFTLTLHTIIILHIFLSSLFAHGGTNCTTSEAAVATGDRGKAPV